MTRMTRMKDRMKRISSIKTGSRDNQDWGFDPVHPATLSKLCSDPLDPVSDPLHPRAIAAPPKTTETPNNGFGDIAAESSSHSALLSYHRPGGRITTSPFASVVRHFLALVVEIRCR
jgi:hypothetical protein